MHYLLLNDQLSLFVDGAERRSGEATGAPHAAFIRRLCDSASPLTLPVVRSFALRAPEGLCCVRPPCDSRSHVTHRAAAKQRATRAQEGMQQREWALLLELLNDGSLYFVSERVDVPEEYQGFARNDALGEDNSSDEDSSSDSEA